MRVAFWKKATPLGFDPKAGKLRLPRIREKIGDKMNFEQIFKPALSEAKFKETSPIMLAFIGDAVHTLFVRDAVVKKNDLLVKDYHKESTMICRAKAQAQMLDELMESLTEKEQDIVRRARNAKIHHMAKNSDLETYKKATAFESLVGYLYLSGNFDRLKQILGD